jgi:hypothetical protein
MLLTASRVPAIQKHPKSDFSSALSVLPQGLVPEAANHLGEVGEVLPPRQ